jgi:Secretion system C-terminal sorting domain
MKTPLNAIFYFALAIFFVLFTFTAANAQIGMVPRKDNILTHPAIEDVVITDIPSEYNVKTGSLTPIIRISPNPASDKVVFEIRNMPFGNYVLRIMNIIGTEVWRQDIKVNTNMNIQASVGKLPKGTYLYNLKDTKGMLVTTKKMIVSRP